MPYGERPTTGFALTDAQTAHFCREGFVVLREVYSSAEVAMLRSRASAALSRLRTQSDGARHGVNFSFAPGPDQGASARNLEVDTLNPHRVAQVDDFHKMDECIEAHMRCPRLTNALTGLLGPDIDAYQVTTITKPPKFQWNGGGYNFHQDVCDYGGGGDTDGHSSNYRYGGMTNFGAPVPSRYLSLSLCFSLPPSRSLAPRSCAR